MAGIFTDADLDALATLAEDLALKDTCDVLRDNGGSDDGEGGLENLDWPVLVTVNCMLTRESVQSVPGESIIADRLDGKTIQRVWFKRGAVDLLKTDLLRINGDLYHIIDLDTESYEVLKPVSVWKV